MKDYDKNNYNIFIDVDETITFNEGQTFIKEAINFIKNNSYKANFYIWSQDGLDYVHKIVLKAGIEDYIVGILPKPDFIIDDLKFNEFSNEFYPNWDKLNNIIKKCGG